MSIQTAIALLQTARLKIESGSEIWICYALDEAFDDVEANPDLPNAEETCDRLHSYIGDQIAPRMLLDSWVFREAGVYPDANLVHLCRLAWIDRMIHELEVSGTLP